MGLIKNIIAVNNMIENKNKRSKFKQVENNSSKNDTCNIDPFASPDVFSLRMVEKTGVLGKKRTFTITNSANDVLYTAKKSGTFQRPRLTLYSPEKEKVGFVKKALSLHKPKFVLEISNNEYILKQTSSFKTLYELEERGWQVKSDFPKTIVCDSHWKKIIEIDLEKWDLKDSIRTDVYNIKLLDHKHEVAAIVIAISMYIAHRLEFQ